MAHFNGLDLGRKRLSHKDRLFKVLEGDFLSSLTLLDQITRKFHHGWWICSPMDVIHKVVSNDGHDVQSEYEALGDTLVVARGVSTGIDHYEDGFSWTTEVEEVLKFAALNCQTKKEIPGVIRATVPKTAVLAMFSFEDEVVIDPTVKKIKVEKHFLRGSELRKFHANVDVEANTRDVLLKTGYNVNRMAAAAAEAEDDDEDEFEPAIPERKGPKNVFER